MPQRVHVPFIDGLRGVAALYVVLSHLYEFSVAGHPSNPLWYKPFGLLSFGHEAVCVFIVISGYCLMLPVVAARGEAARWSLPQFVRRRARRILPPYFATLGLVIAAIVMVPALQRESGTPWDVTLPNLTVGNVVSHLLIVHNWFVEWRWGFVPPMWTVALEFQIYLVFGVLLLPLWRRRGGAAVVLVAFALASMAALAGGGFAYPYLLVGFSLGMAAAAVSWSEDAEHRRLRGLDWSRLALVAVLALPAIYAALSLVPVDGVPSFPQDLFTSAAAALALVALGLEDRGPIWRFTARLLSSGLLSGLGRFSYSLYLTHYPIVALVAILLVKGRGMNAPEELGLLGVIALPLALVFAYSFYFVVERPFLNSPAVPRRRVAPAVA